MSKLAPSQAGGSEPWGRREEQEQRLDQDNRGFQLLERLGWEEGAGFGSSRQGITEPLAKSGQGGHRQGLGTAAGGQGDQFDTYRKRMMTSYKHRPNPMKNPRRDY